MSSAEGARFNVSASDRAPLHTRQPLPQEMARGTRVEACDSSSSSGSSSASGGYGVGAYFLAKLMVDTPVDSLFAMLFAAVVAPMAGLNSKNRFEATLSLICLICHFSRSQRCLCVIYSASSAPRLHHLVAGERSRM